MICKFFSSDSIVVGYYPRKAQSFTSMNGGKFSTLRKNCVVKQSNSSRTKFPKTKLQGFGDFTIYNPSNIIKRFRESRDISVCKGQGQHQHWMPMTFNPSGNTAKKQQHDLLKRYYYMGLGKPNTVYGCIYNYKLRLCNTNQKPYINNI